MLSDKEVYPIWRKLFGSSTKLGSRPQFGRVLRKLGFDFELTETELDKVDRVALEKIKLPFVRNFQQIERLKKTRSTYLDGIAREIVQHGKHWYVHPNFNLNIAATFRSTSDNPNVQNIPVRNPEISKIVRQCYIPPPGWHIVEIDFAQLEVRIAYCYHKDPTMGKYLRDNHDMHKEWAAKIYKLELNQVSKNARYAAKNMFVFPQFYGSFYAQCAPNLWEAIDQLPGMNVVMPGDDPKNPTGPNLRDHLRTKGVKAVGDCVFGNDPKPGTLEKHLQQLEKELWTKSFPVYAQWKKNWYKAYLQDGGFSILTGFAINGLHKRTDVINYPVQGAAFHCLMKAMMKVQSSFIEKYKMRSRYVNQIHDCSVAYVPPDELQDYVDYSIWAMTKYLPRAWPWIICPLDAEVEVAPLDRSWAEKTEWTKQGTEWRLKI